MDSSLLKKLHQLTLKATTINSTVESEVVQEEAPIRRRRRGIVEHIDDRAQKNMLKEQL